MALGSLLALAAACPGPGPSIGPDMSPGEDCLSCHAAGGAASQNVFTMAGTVFGSATASADGGVFAEIEITDANGQQVTLQSNASGNFYTSQRLAFPAQQVQIVIGGQTFPMQEKPPSGSCNTCHAVQVNADGTLQVIPRTPLAVDAGIGTPPGRLFAFASDGGCPPPPSGCSSAPSYQGQVASIIEGACLPCHGVGGVAQNWLLTDLSQVQAQSTNLGQVSGCKMPPVDAAALSPEQGALLLAWLACGDPNN